jgi:hypothetical protein
MQVPADSEGSLSLRTEYTHFPANVSAIGRLHDLSAVEDGVAGATIPLHDALSVLAPKLVPLLEGGEGGARVDVLLGFSRSALTSLRISGAAVLDAAYRMQAVNSPEARGLLSRIDGVVRYRGAGRHVDLGFPDDLPVVELSNAAPGDQNVCEG